MSNAETMRKIIDLVHENPQHNILLESKSKQHPLEDHPYHKKTEAALKYVIKDAGEAAKAMKDHSPKSESKYLDQVNDASTVLSWRKKHGMPDWYKEKYGHKKD